MERELRKSRYNFLISDLNGIRVTKNPYLFLFIQLLFQVFFIVINYTLH